MYNAFIAKKKATLDITHKRHSETTQKYVKRYYNVVRPVLIDNYNKRINSFIRKLQEEPIKVSLSPHQKEQKQDCIQPEQETRFIGEHTFKFKDNEDWKSMYTPWERIERKKNYELFKLKYGEPDLAFRSIGSQSQYNPSLANQFRVRSKSKQINPPMKYTNKPTKQVLANLKKNRFKLKSENRNKNNKQMIASKRTGQTNQDEEVVGRRNTGSSLGGLEDNVSQYDYMSNGRETQNHQSNRELEELENLKNTEKNKKKELKLHFKQIMDLQQNIDDVQTKKALRDLLYKCGIYRRKNRRAVTQSDIDRFSELESTSAYQK